MNIATILFILAGLVLIVNIITEVIKKLTWDKLPTPVLAFITSEVVTLLAFYAYCSIKAVEVYWYYYIATVIAGFFVSYAAMFGYDTLKTKILSWYSSRSGTVTEEKDE